MPSDSGMTAAEQAALDADKAAEVAEIQEEAAAPVVETPEAGAEDAGAPEPGQEQPQRQGMVPHAALHEAREKLKAAEARALEADRKAQLVEERTNIILQRFAAPQQPQAQPAQPMPEIPAFDQDPAGHILGQVRQQGAILSELVQAVTGQHRQSEMSAEAQQIANEASALEREFAAATPDYDKASNYLFETRRKMLRATGQTSAAAIEKRMKDEAFGLAYEARALGRNPAEFVYELAKAVGYVPAPENNEAVADNGAAASEGQLRTIAAGQQQSRSVGNLRGSGPVPLNANRLAEMSHDEFADMMKKNPEGVKALMGV